MEVGGRVAKKRFGVQVEFFRTFAATVSALASHSHSKLPSVSGFQKRLLLSETMFECACVQPLLQLLQLLLLALHSTAALRAIMLWKKV